MNSNDTTPADPAAENSGETPPAPLKTQKPKTTAKKDTKEKAAKKKAAEDKGPAAAELATETSVTKPANEATIPASIRLWLSAFNALKAMMAKYGRNMVDMTSISIIAYAKKAAAVPVVKFRTLEDKILFALQAAATDIRAGLSNLRNDLYEARKSRRDPELLQGAYADISAKYQKALAHADETLTLIDRELTLRDLLKPSDHALLIQAIHNLERTKPKTRSEAQLLELCLRILKTLIH